MNSNFRKKMYAGAPSSNRHQPHTMNMDNATLYKEECIEKMPIAMAYVPWQQWREVYDPNKALKIGTIFPELNLPFLGMGGDR